MSDKLTLEVLIKTTLERAGVTAGKEEIKQLTETIQRASAASKDFTFSSDVVTDALTKQRAAAAAAGNSWETMSADQKGAMRDAAQLAVRNIESAEAAKKAASAAAGLSKNLGTLKAAGAGVGQVFQGAVNGNLLQMGQGFTSIAKAVNDASPALQKFFAQVGRGAAIGSSIAGPVLVAIQIAQDKAKDNQQFIDRVYKEQAASSANHTAMIVADAARREKALAKELKAIQELAAAYEDARARTDKAYGRDERLDPLKRKLRDEELNTQEKEALAKARTPEEREKIKRNFDLRRKEAAGFDAADDFDSAEARADIEKQKAEEALTGARQKNREADLAVIAAKQRFDRALEETRTFKPTSNSPAAQAARDRAQAAKVDLDQATKDRDKVFGETGEIIKSAQEEIDAANLMKEETALRRAAYEAMAKGRVAELSTPDPQRTKDAEAAGKTAADIEGRIKAEETRAATSSKFGDTPKTDALKAELAAARKSEAEAYRAISEDAKARRKETELLKQQMKNTREGGA